MPRMLITRAILALGLVDDGGMRFDPLLFHQPTIHLVSAASAIAGEMLWIEAKAHHHPLDHGARGTNLSLAKGTRRFDIDDNRVVDIDQIVGGLGKERRPAMSSGPLSSRIRWRDELRLDLACSTNNGIRKTSPP